MRPVWWQAMTAWLAGRRATTPVRRAESHVRTPAGPLQGEPLAAGEVAAHLQRSLHALALSPHLVGEPAGEGSSPLAEAVDRALQDRDWATRQLPRRPQLLPQLIQTVNDDAASARVMAAIIGQDPVLTGNLLRIANSPAYKAHERPVESLQRAVTLVGTEGVRQIISAVLVQPVMQVQCDVFPQFSTIIWEHALLASRAAADHARTVTFGDAFAAQWLGLVQGLGAALVMRQVLQEAQGRGSTVDAALALDLLQRWSLPLAQRVAAAWDLPEPVHQALAADAQGPLADSLRLGSAAAAASLLCRHGHGSQVRMQALLEQLPSAPPHALRWIWRRLHGRAVETLDEAGAEGGEAPVP
ncbi:HDOD domain-containing protein [Stenotrophomonas sp. YAU14D1_LEIMI4_1]|uniref:HDOD domain-containing protein n=1 Tax=Stenotrophomonas sp. YAU14D1_LEIMI4_1 TaxID=2072407 RepID=UPI000D53D41B|nr:HDOD domain-containing protein [Stenotrophomonas sp. YAU14D1_LEIMI4_1]AWH26155.1 histidine kinase [Stenotrophomonas sp. YAU14D1_LEIMI4_1]